jgi:hypothetical protein
MAEEPVALDVDEIEDRDGGFPDGVQVGGVRGVGQVAIKPVDRRPVVAEARQECGVRAA